MAEEREPAIAFGVWLDIELAKRNMSPADLKRATGIYASTISKYRNGVQGPREKQAKLIADALDIPLSVVLHAADKGRGMRAGSSMTREAVDLLSKIPDDLLPLALPYLESLADERRWSRYRTALAESARVRELPDGPDDGPELEISSETESTEVPEREPQSQSV